MEHAKQVFWPNEWTYVTLQPSTRLFKIGNGAPITPMLGVSKHAPAHGARTLQALQCPDSARY